MTCTECGFAGQAEFATCVEQWHALLALDHSRQAPWGPLHGVAFATWTLQHPHSSRADSVERAFGVLHSLFVEGVPHERLFRLLRDARGRPPEGWNPPALPMAAPKDFSLTIAHLGDMSAAGYEAKLWEWARSTFADWFERRRELGDEPPAAET